jgi:hypothetical protein
MQSIRRQWALPVLLLAVAAAVLVAAYAPSTSAGVTEPRKPWTAAGSTGIVDEADTNEIKFTAGKVQIKDNADLPATAVVRYNVTAEDRLFTYDTAVMRYLVEDNGDDSRVLLELVAYNIKTHKSAVFLTADSNDLPSGDEPINGDVTAECGVSFDFASYAYVVKVTLEKTGSAGTPALHNLKVESTDCISS